MTSASDGKPNGLPGRPIMHLKTPSGASQGSTGQPGNADGFANLPEGGMLSPGLGQEQIADLNSGTGDDYGLNAAFETGADLPADESDGQPTPTAFMEEGLPLLGGEEGEPAVPTGFERSTSSSNAPQAQWKATEGVLHRMHKFALYETLTRFYLVGHDLLDRRYRVLKIDRTASAGQLNIVEDETVYTRHEMNQLLNTIEDGNKSVGGIRYRGTSWGLLGFIRFTDTYYMLVISKKTQIATIGGHYVYQIEDTDLVPLTMSPASKIHSGKNPHEARFLSILGNLDLNRHFYFSYSYNITRTLQENTIKRRRMLSRAENPAMRYDFNDMFVWNQHLLEPAIEALKCPYDWCMPIIHGFIDQSSVDVFGRSIYITLIARRSRFFAGARFLKRGANDLGFVANDVETEQIVADMLVTSLNTPRLKYLQNPNYTAFVQHRGSVPLYWTQDNSGVSPKPAIDLNLIDPFYTTAALHFDNLFERYRAPIYVLNLVKARERTPRESKLLVEYQNAIKYLNQSLPDDKKIRYRAYDMSRAAKTPGQDVIRTLEEIAEDIVKTTGYFRNDGDPGDLTCVQNGVVRSNCIDCLDRTNAAQFVVGKKALACQLQALGVITDTSLNYDSDASNLFAHMFNDQGDTLASQYGGSHLVNTTDSYRKISNWQSHSRDMLESFKRYYHNSFLDSQRQEAYNLFLGNYIYAHGEPMLWELPNDYYLHHANPAQRAKRHDYVHWFTPEHLSPRQLPMVPPMTDDINELLRKDWWDEYYRPLVLSSYHKLFAFHMNSTTRYLPKPGARHGHFDLSPFSVRKAAHELDSHADTHTDVKKELHAASIPGPLSATAAHHNPTKRIASLQKWVGAAPAADAPARPPAPPRDDFAPPDKTHMSQWTLAQLHADSLRPSVSAADAAEYELYLAHPLTVPLVVDDAAAEPDGAVAAYASYIGGEARAADASSEDRAALGAWLGGEPEPIGVAAGDLERKRYNVYGKWVRGKSLFKQSRADGEARGSAA